jgi:hypothetical protein
MLYFRDIIKTLIMPMVKCLECNLTISFPCDPTTGLFGMTAIAEEAKKTENDKNNKNRVLTLECKDGHRRNYPYPEVCKEKIL